MERGPAGGLGKCLAHFPKRDLLIPSGNQRRLASGSASSTPSGPAPLTQVKPGRERTLRGPGGGTCPACARPPGPRLATARGFRLRAPALCAPLRGPAAPSGRPRARGRHPRDPGQARPQPPAPPPAPPAPGSRGAGAPSPGGVQAVRRGPGVWGRGGRGPG